MFFREHFCSKLEPFFPGHFSQLNFGGSLRSTPIQSASSNISTTSVGMFVNVNNFLDKNVNLGIGQFVPILFSLIDIIKLSFLKIDRS